MMRRVTLAITAGALVGLAACDGYWGNPGLSGPTSAGIEQSMESGALTPSEAQRANRILVEGN